MLDKYRRSFREAYLSVYGKVVTELGIHPTGRSEKSNSSILDKLRREETRHGRLSQVQDVAGCRLVVQDVNEQNATVEKLKKAFERVRVMDRRGQPSHGYRAVHIIVEENGRLVEIQIRSRLQHLWAEYCERLADAHDPMLKYGGGPGPYRYILGVLSESIAKLEAEWNGLSEEHKNRAVAIMRLNLDGVPPFKGANLEAQE